MSSQSSPPSPARVPDGRTPLWRAHNIFRFLTLGYAMCWCIVLQGEYARPHLATGVLALMTGWTALTFWRYRTKAGRKHWLVFADQVFVTVLYFSSEWVLTPEQITSYTTSVLTLWHASMITAAAIQWGTLGGFLSGTVASICNFVLRNDMHEVFTYFHYEVSNMMCNDTLLMVGAGLILGMASNTARRSAERLSSALRLEAATAERERLARSIHDSVLQVLARVRRRGNELGGEAAELAQLAGEQEIALRSLVSTAPPESTEDGEMDLAGKLKVLGTAKVHVSTPATPVLLPAGTTTELFAVVSEALENVDRHAGPDAKAWIFLEDLGDEIRLSIRDDGPGIPRGRLDAAVSEGRMGVAQSIQGRVRSLGGTILLETELGEGTEWEVRVPRPSNAERPGSRQGGQR